MLIEEWTSLRRRHRDTDGYGATSTSSRTAPNSRHRALGPLDHSSAIVASRRRQRQLRRRRRAADHAGAAMPSDALLEGSARSRRLRRRARDRDTLKESEGDGAAVQTPPHADAERTGTQALPSRRRAGEARIRALEYAGIHMSPRYAPGDLPGVTDPQRFGASLVCFSDGLRTLTCNRLFRGKWRRARRPARGVGSRIKASAVCSTLTRVGGRALGDLSAAQPRLEWFVSNASKLWTSELVRCVGLRRAGCQLSSPDLRHRLSERVTISP